MTSTHPPHSPFSWGSINILKKVWLIICNPFIPKTLFIRLLWVLFLNSGQKYHKVMERVQLLIDKLVAQKQQNESPSQLLMTVQLLQQELLQLQQGHVTRSTGKVAVVMPSRVYPEAGAFEETQPKKEETANKPAPEKAAPASEEQKPVVEGFDPMAETPTLIQQKAPEKKGKKEINQVVSSDQPSLNDKLKQPKTEVAHKLQDSPVKDLRRAIGINDRFVFLKELFNGDEVMYERSIKTINNFQILQEAEFWINRELKLRLGWNDNKEAVQHFYQLVRRRFS